MRRAIVVLASSRVPPHPSRWSHYPRRGDGPAGFTHPLDPLLIACARICEVQRVGKAPQGVQPVGKAAQGAAPGGSGRCSPPLSATVVRHGVTRAPLASAKPAEILACGLIV